MENIITIDDKFYKESQIVILPTNKHRIGGIAASNGNKHLLLVQDRSYLSENTEDIEHWIPQHLYFLSDDEIEEGDLVYYHHPRQPLDFAMITKIKRLNYSDDPAYAIQHTEGYGVKEGYKKIIASTDPSLNLSQPSQEFLKQYVEGQGIDKVLIEQNRFRDYNALGSYKYTYEPVTIRDFLAIKSISTKDSWNREEVIELLEKILYSSPGMISTYPDGTVDHVNKIGGSAWSPSFNTWIEQNLK